MKTTTLPLLSILCLALLLTVGCEGDTSSKWKTGDHLKINAETAAAMIDKNPELVVLDVRTPAETTLGLIEGAKQLDFHNDNFEKDLAALDKSVPYLVYCRSGSRSSQTATMMKSLGFAAVYNCDDGYESLAKAQSGKD